MNIYVLGSNGMLGKYVSKYMSTYYSVTEVTRKDLDVSDLNKDQLSSSFDYLGIQSADLVVNCIGTIKPMVDSLGDLNAIKINSVFPRLLAEVCKYKGVKLIHPTTDCVFTGKRGSYTEKDIHDISDVYGRTKSLGENNDCCIIRTSIIGEEVHQGRSLIEWIKSQNNKTINGFTNHWWNGVTCLQFAKICKQILDYNMFWEGCRHIFSNTITKEQLLKLVIQHYNLNIVVNPIEAAEPCDRSLSSCTDFYQQFGTPSLDTQIKELKEFSETLYS